MSYFSEQELKSLGFKKLGRNVKISKKASIYDYASIELGNNIRIDDFCVVSGKLKFGNFIHITPQCLVAGGTPGIEFGDYSTLAYGVKIFTQSDDYSGETMTNSLIPKEFKREKFDSIRVGAYSIVGAGSTIMPGAHIGEGVAVGAMALVLKPTEDWKIYAGNPAKILKERSKNLLNLAKKFQELK